MKYYATVDHDTHEIELASAEEGMVEVRMGEKPFLARLEPRGGGNLFRAWIGSRRVDVTVLGGSGNATEIAIDGVRFLVEVEHEVDRILGSRSTESGTAAWTQCSVMPGIVTRVLVGPGDAVAESQPMLILEAMKMENEVRAERAARVQEIHVAAGDTVESGAPLLTLLPGE